MRPPAPARRIALFGECMLELTGQAFGSLRQGFGGDTLNTALYLARCAPQCSVQYATALGDDPLSDGLAARWAAEGLGLDLLRRLPGRLPGLYMIEVDAGGERRFHYWRDQAAARSYFDTPPGATPLEAEPLPCDLLYLSGISLAILPPAGRSRLYALMERLRAAGGQVVFDNNHRPRLWPDPAEARAAYEAAFARADTVLLTLDDHQAWLGRGQVLGAGDGQPVAAEAALAHAAALAAPELVVKRGGEATLCRLGAGQPWHSVPTEAVAQVIDTTAAGDSFAAGYLARRLAGAAVAEAAAFGNRLAARVIQHPGAVIPREAMADLLGER
ncbi:sugar kinase [Aquabacterium sp. OR-4]|uniref:sugar kinase n=1 Tax=Aquabacterium sp. OR-4 TaxID=2978127 RepID=UPI0021B1C360|nr:sugar kinase [Aquabacterium sp. OR-4]MDT7837080.1 sugar kinase [Aquabacterium sp. OR-4]